MSLFKAIKLMYHQEIGFKSRLKTDTIQVAGIESLKGTNLESDIYSPIRKQISTIILINGMSMQGHRDPRIVKLSESLAHCGFKVITPYFTSISNLEIDPEQALQIRDFIERVSRDESITTDEKLAVMSVSFSAGMCLKAASLLNDKSILKAMCLIGGYADLFSTLDFLLFDTNADEYGRLVVLKNFIHFVYPDPGLGRAFYLAALLNSSATEINSRNLKDHLDKLTPETRKLYLNILQDQNLKLQIKNKLLNNPKLQDYVHRLDILKVVPDIQSSVTLIHGKDDNVIDPKQSSLLHKSLQESNKTSHICITNLLAHGNTQYNLKLAGEVGRLLRALGFFFRSLKGQ